MVAAALLALSVPFRVAGYLPDWRAASFQESWAKGLTEVIVFSASPKSDGSLDTRLLDQFPWDKLRSLREKQGLRVTFAVGGWGRGTANFPVVAHDPKLRQAFAVSVNMTCDKYRLDGVDFDWEHPKNPTEEADYGKLLQAVKESFKGKDRTTSLTIAGWQKLPRSAFAYADFVQVMAYDHEGKHSTMEDTVKDLDLVAALGAKPAQTVLGLPFYGRTYRNQRSEATYADLAGRFKLKPGDDTAGDFYFNGPETVAAKVALAQKRKLAGVMIWEIGQDTTGSLSLLAAINRAKLNPKPVVD
ncbi:MAG: glycoside hydrolase family 18 protein [Fimbriimonadaceae bacterium]|nr:glycoside hydrolase family 18 protein [Fimbriimonadaceae bacterium]